MYDAGSALLILSMLMLMSYTNIINWLQKIEHRLHPSNVRMDKCIHVFISSMNLFDSKTIEYEEGKLHRALCMHFDLL